jgi:rubrerythrin
MLSEYKEVSKMAGSIKGTQTEKNLMIAFANESMAVNRYGYFAKVAEKEGRKKIADAFRETAEEEKAHAEVFYKYFEGGSVEVAVAFPAAAVADTKSNLSAAIAGEHATWTIRYEDSEKTARSEGFFEIADVFRQIGASEKAHEIRLKKMAE